MIRFFFLHTFQFSKLILNVTSTLMSGYVDVRHYMTLHDVTVTSQWHQLNDQTPDVLYNLCTDNMRQFSVFILPMGKLRISIPYENHRFPYLVCENNISLVQILNIAKSEQSSHIPGRSHQHPDSSIHDTSTYCSCVDQVSTLCDSQSLRKERWFFFLFENWRERKMKKLWEEWVREIWFSFT